MDKAGTREVKWNDCDAFARYLGADGRERVVICNLECHAAPDDATAEHVDEDLEICWRYLSDKDD